MRAYVSANCDSIVSHSWEALPYYGPRHCRICTYDRTLTRKLKNADATVSLQPLQYCDVLTEALWVLVLRGLDYNSLSSINAHMFKGLTSLQTMYVRWRLESTVALMRVESVSEFLKHVFIMRGGRAAVRLMQNPLNCVNSNQATAATQQYSHIQQTDHLAIASGHTTGKLCV